MRGEAAPGGDRGHGHQLAEDIPEGGPDAEEHGAGQVAEGPQKVLYDDSDKYPVARFELWRLYMTDKDTVPVQRMTQDTRPGDLQLTHAASPFNETRRRVRVNRYWNEEFLIVIQHNINHSFNDIFVWKWKECQNPQFLYSHDLLPLYPTGKNAF